MCFRSMYKKIQDIIFHMNQPGYDFMLYYIVYIGLMYSKIWKANFEKRNSIHHEPKKSRKDHRKIDFVELSLLLQLMGHTMCGRELKIQYNS